MSEIENLNFELSKSEVLFTETVTGKGSRKVGRPKGSKGGGPKKFCVIPFSEEVPVMFKMPKQLKDIINAKATEQGKTFKELVTTSLMRSFMPVQEEVRVDVPETIADALVQVANNSFAFFDLPMALQTPVTLQAAIASHPKAIGYLLERCPDHLTESVTKEQWMDAVSMNRNVLDMVPAKYRKVILKVIAQQLAIKK